MTNAGNKPNGGGAPSGVRIGRLGVPGHDPVALVREDPRLRECPLVQALGEASPSVLAEARVLRVAEGLELIDGSAPAGDLLLVRQGRLSVVAADDRVPVVEVGPGEIAGCAAALGREPGGLSVVVAEPSEIVAIPAQALALAVAMMPAVRSLLEEVLDGRVRRVGEVDDFLGRW